MNVNNSDDRIESLLLIKWQLEQWLAYQPEWHVEKYGGGEANIAYQHIKQLIAYELQVQALEDSADEGLGLYNLQ
jgi:hypothetical protein